MHLPPKPAPKPAELAEHTATPTAALHPSTQAALNALQDKLEAALSHDAHYVANEISTRPLLSPRGHERAGAYHATARALEMVRELLDGPEPVVHYRHFSDSLIEQIRADHSHKPTAAARPAATAPAAPRARGGAPK